MTNYIAYLSDRKSASEALEQKMKRRLPKRIILVRHGESEGNVDEAVLGRVPNHKIELTEKGRQQARAAGPIIRDIVSEKGECRDWKAFFYISPSRRVRETAEEIIGGGETFPAEKVVGVREECRLREQHFGNFQEAGRRKRIKRSRVRYGKFFYRVPDGESSADVYDRVSAFVEGLWSDTEYSSKYGSEADLIVVTHGLTIQVLLMKWFNWSADQFDGLANPGNCEYRVLQLGPHGEYSLALHHQAEELRQWGLSEEMIRDQMARAGGGVDALPDRKRSWSQTSASEDESG